MRVVIRAHGKWCLNSSSGVRVRGGVNVRGRG